MIFASLNYVSSGRNTKEEELEGKNVNVMALLDQPSSSKAPGTACGNTSSTSPLAPLRCLRPKIEQPDRGVHCLSPIGRPQLSHRPCSVASLAGGGTESSVVARHLGDRLKAI